MYTLELTEPVDRFSVRSFFFPLSWCLCCSAWALSSRVVSKYLRSQVLSGGCGWIVELSKQKVVVMCTSGKMDLSAYSSENLTVIEMKLTKLYIRPLESPYSWAACHKTTDCFQLLLEVVQPVKRQQAFTFKKPIIWCPISLCRRLYSSV